MSIFMDTFTIWLFMLTGIARSALDSSKRRGDPTLQVLVNKVWPIHNTVETYRYYDFGFCHPDEIKEYEMSFGELLRGDRLMNTEFGGMEYGVNVTRREVCSRDLSVQEIAQFVDGIHNRYVFEMQFGDSHAPVIIPFGVSPLVDIVNLCNHLVFRLGANRDHGLNIILDARAECLEYTNILKTNRVSFFYSVEWFETSMSRDPQIGSIMSAFGLRSSLSVNEGSSPIHWMSIANSFILALMIVGLVSIILLRVVRADLAEESEEAKKFIEGGEPPNDNNSSGGGYWKLLHGDVFRPPLHRMWICAAIGSSAMAGFVSARMYHRIGGVKWTWNILVTAFFFTVPAFAIWAILNTVAIAYNSTAAFPFGVILQLFAMWALVTIPLTVIGGVLGRHSGMKLVQKKPFPTRTNRLAREIPSYNFFASMRFQILITGFITFWSIYIELKFVFQSIWTNDHIYKLYGVLVVSVLLLLLLSTSLTVLFTYFHLNAENYKWWWRSFLSGASIALFVYGYCIYYYANSIMEGFFQTIFFFLYSLLFVYALALMIGATSFLATYRFVWFIFSHVKTD